MLYDYCKAKIPKIFKKNILNVSSQPHFRIQGGGDSLCLTSEGGEQKVLCLISDSYTTSHIFNKTVIARELKFWEMVHFPPPVMCHVWTITCHKSGVTFSYFFFTKRLSLSVEGLVSMGPTQSIVIVSYPEKNEYPAYGKQRISQTMWIVAPIPNKSC